jgi:hypothetical protein
MGSKVQQFVPQPEQPTTRGSSAFAAAANNGQAINAAPIGPAAAVQTGAVVVTPHVSGKFRLTVNITGVTDADDLVSGAFAADGNPINTVTPPGAVVQSGGVAHRFGLNAEAITAAYAVGTPVSFDYRFDTSVGIGSNITVGIGQSVLTVEELPG